MFGIVLGIQHLHQTLDLHGVVGGIFVEIPDVLDDLGHLVDGVVATLRGGAVAGHTVHIHTDLHAATVATVDAAVGGLSGNDELHLAAGVIGAVEVLVDDGLPAHTVAVLLLHGAHHHDLIAGGDEAQILHDPGAVGGGGHAALLIGAAAAVDDIVGFVALIGVGLPVVPVADAHGVHVGVQSDDLVALAHPADDVAQLVELDLVIPQSLHLLGDAMHHALLLTGFGRNGDHVPQELDHSGLIALGCFFDGFEIHSIPPFKFYDRDRRIQTNYLPLQHHHTTVPADVKQKFMKPKSFSE